MHRVIHQPAAEVLDAPATAEALRPLLARGSIRSVSICGSAAQAPGLAGHRLTRWPFFKLLLRGRLDVLDSDGSLRLRAGPGDLLVFPASTYANVRYPEPNTHFRATIMSEATFLAWNDITTPSSPPQGPVEHLRGHLLERRPSRLTRELITRLGTWDDTAARRDTWRVLCREWLAGLTARGAAIPLSGRGRYLEIRRFLEEHSHEPLTRDSVAAAFGLSPGFVSRLFRRHSTAGFHETLAELRLGHARTLLAASTLRVADVAARCGFSSQNYFAQAFHRAEGLSPSEWRQVHQGEVVE